MNTPNVTRTQRNQVKQAIRDKYAWPGGYPLFIIMSDGGTLHPDCAKAEFHQIAWDWSRHCSTGWNAVAADVNYEDASLYCDHCNQLIESAYGEVQP